MLRLKTKLTLVLLLSLIFTYGTTYVIAETHDKLVAGGCATEYFLMMDLTEKFNLGNLVTIDPRKTGNMKGLKLLLGGTTDFAFLSMHHKMLAQQMGIPEDKIKNIESVEIAIEPILVIVSPDAKVSNLTKEQIVDIFNGAITNWKETGGADLKITPGVLNQDAKSGLYEAFKMKTVGIENDFKGKNITIKDPSVSSTFVKNSRGGITYIGLSTYNNDTSKAIAVSINGVEPSDENFVNGRYPLISKYYITYNKNNLQSIEPFMNFIKSPQGQDIIKQKMIPTM